MCGVVPPFKQRVVQIIRNLVVAVNYRFVPRSNFVLDYSFMRGSQQFAPLFVNSTLKQKQQ